MTVTSAATWLFAPGSRPELFAKAAAAGADEVVLDLEDAVAPPAKEQARRDVADWLRTEGSAWVRVNAAHTTWHAADLLALSPCAGLRGIMIPKAEEPDELSELVHTLESRTPVISLIESAVGVVNALAIARTPGVARLAFGSIDYSGDIDADETDDSMLLARTTLVLASRAAGLPGPIDGVTTDVSDGKSAGIAARHGRSLGFAGKLCIHPGQLRGVAAAFTPTEAEVSWAGRVIDASSTSAGVVKDASGQMIDKPVVDRARRILERSGAPLR